MARKAKAKNAPDNGAEPIEIEFDEPINLDGLLKFMFSLSDSLIIRMINYLFTASFPLTAKVVIENVESPKVSADGKTISTRIFTRINIPK